MSSPDRQLHLGVFVINAGNHIAGWRHAGANDSSEDFRAILDVARIAEQAKMDFVFFADEPSCVLDNHPGYILQLEPTSLLGALAASTSRIGLVATVSSTSPSPTTSPGSWPRSTRSAAAASAGTSSPRPRRWRR